ncbi:MAG: hypothetical protein NC399_01645 [Muribaculum sp.]|nr:hypothetical protein [Muribaculum sp.]
MKNKNLLKMVSFMLIFCVLLSGLNVIFQPVWEPWNNYNTVYGFYEQPEDTIETLFLGTSTTIAGITPMEIYKNYGICAYNLGTEQQPFLASYYWLQETYRLHPQSLKTVVLDASRISGDVPASFYHKSLDGMRFSPVKYHAVMDHVGDFWDGIEYLVPLMSYHERWTTMSGEEFDKLKLRPDASVRGYLFSNKRYLDRVSYDKIPVPEYIYDETAEASEISEESACYFGKIAEFCADKGIKLVLIKNPASLWEAKNHRSAQELADRYGLDFIDFNFAPYIDEIDYNVSLDTMDGLHLNYNGACKVSDWLGDYLVRECNGTDVRDNPKYAFLDEELAQYERRIIAARMEELSDPCEYVEAYADAGDFTILIAVRGDAANALTDTQRDAFRDMGFTALADLEDADSYIGILADEGILYEEAGKSALTKAGRLLGGKRYDVASGGFDTGDTASCVIDDTEYALNKRGLNLVVYDNVGRNVADAVVFDTHESPVRERRPEELLDEYLCGAIPYEDLTPSAQKLYLYQMQCEEKRFGKGAADAVLICTGEQ